MSLREGLGQLVSRLQEQLPPGVAAPRSEVLSITRDHSFVLRLGDGSAVRAAAVLLATPAHVTSSLTAALDPTLSDLCGAIQYRPSINVALGYAPHSIHHPLHGWGFVVPAREGGQVRSASWVSSKWPGRAPAGHALIRASMGGAGGVIPDGQGDDTLIAAAHDELRTLLGIRTKPVMARVYRRPQAMPQLEVGHLERMAAIDARLASIPGLFVSASGFRGVGLPDCISDARAVAGQADTYLQAMAARGAA